MSGVEFHMTWLLFPILLTVVAVLLWATLIWFGIFKLRKEREADEARAEHERLENSVLGIQLQYLRDMSAFRGPTQSGPAAVPSQAL
ncbi:hypothetical protein L211DRAFT_718978 [Terfezia boudieri ATCC MYA-4762]|uniref:Uncharacterized protein n=1 Tax=Terfezia boudieri ATCC MYA-4762 TaxID=1051890 RepID=A0A3N4L6Y2_9PEZI|nr:hypothetical protein L211DRAFT_718978 [Terfezia boudieri ATCC MYA-4762]